jgi:hypothetical protein
MEAKDVTAARALFFEIESKAPEATAATSSAQYIDQVIVGETRLEQGRFEPAAQSLFAARRAVAGDARRLGIVDAHFASLRASWIKSVKAAAAAAGADEGKFYADVVSELSQVARTLQPLGVTREQVLDEFKKGDGR